MLFQCRSIEQPPIYTLSRTIPQSGTDATTGSSIPTSDFVKLLPIIRTFSSSAVETAETPKITARKKTLKNRLILSLRKK